MFVLLLLVCSELILKSSFLCSEKKVRIRPKADLSNISLEMTNQKTATKTVVCTVYIGFGLSYELGNNSNALYLIGSLVCCI